jgi:hypothetical protein
MVELASVGNTASPAPVGGRRHRKSAKKVSAKTIRRTLRKLGMRPKGRVVLKGGAEGEAEAVAPEMKAGRRRRRHGGVSISMPGRTHGRKGRRSSKVSLKLPGLGKLPF